MMLSNKPFLYKYWLIFKIGMYVIIPILLLVLPDNFFDDGQSICFSVLLFNSECFGCGITRAIMHLIHFDFSTAIEYNKLVVIVFPLLIWVWFSSFYKDFKKYKTLY